jgi:putative protein-disulfide isomerase
MADQLEVICYTDPLCCWSWAMEPSWRRLLHEYEGVISYRYCMGGLISDWRNYNDVFNSVSRPAQMGPLWMHASEVSGAPMHSRIWIDDPPASSYLACIAVKCAEMQSIDIGDAYLLKLRENLMLNGINISRQSALFDVTQNISGLNLKKFEKDIKGNAGTDAFDIDLQNVLKHGIDRFPTFIFKKHNKGVLLIGYNSYDALKEPITKILSM